MSISMLMSLEFVASHRNMLVKQLRKAEWRYEQACMDGKVDPLLELIERNWLNHYEKFFFMNSYTTSSCRRTCPNSE